MRPENPLRIAGTVPDPNGRPLATETVHPPARARQRRRTIGDIMYLGSCGSASRRPSEMPDDPDPARADLRQHAL
jgi:hypothetical protein